MGVSWPTVRLGEVLRQVSRAEPVDPTKDYRLLGVRLDGQGPFLRETVSGGETAAMRLHRVAAGDFIYSRLFAWRGAFGIISPDLDACYVSGEFPTFTPVSDRLDTRFLRYWFRLPTTLALVESDCSGSTPLTRNRFKEQFFLGLEIPLPPLGEQRRIVGRIEALAAEIESARRLRKEAVQEAEAVTATYLVRLFDEGGERGWLSGSLGDYVADDCYGTSEKTTDDSTGTPVLRMGNIQSGEVDLRNLKYLQFTEKDRRKLFLRRGDILVNRTNSAELVGKCAVFDVEGDFSFASYLIRLRLELERAVPQLVAAYINSPRGRAYMFNERRQMTGQANVNATKLKALPIALPPLPDQRRIVAELDALQAEVDRLKVAQAETAAELDALLPSILDRAFKGAS
jgi:type I restriction enzyme S subunit